MALLTPTAITTAGTTQTLAAVNSTDTVAADDSMWLVVTNGSGSSINVTVSDSGLTPAGNAASTSAVAVANGATKLIPLTAKTNSASTGLTTITYSATSSVTAAVFRK